MAFIAAKLIIPSIHFTPGEEKAIYLHSLIPEVGTFSPKIL